MRRGLTMLEVLVAAAVLATGLLGALEVITQTARVTRSVRDHSRAQMFARAKLEEILKEPVLQIGTDQGKGIDETTDYDWEATIEQSQNPALVVVAVAARNRVTGTTVTLYALRRPDLETLPDDGTGTTGTAEEGTDTGDAGTGGAGGAQ